MGLRAPMLVTLAFVAVAFAGCADDSGFDFRPGTGFKVTGETVHLKMSVADNLMREVFPGFFANLWAFCAAPFDPTDEYSANAIEHWATLESDGRYEGAQTGDDTCSVPGPQLRVKQGDRVIVEFSHSHFHCHTIHWHGQFVPWKSDGVPGVTQDSTCPGESFTYDFVAARAGSLWYHCHVDTHFHVMQGLYGVIIVEPQDTKWEPKGIDKEFTFVYGSLNRNAIQATPVTVADPHFFHKSKGGCGETGTPNCQNPSADTAPDVWTLNGRSAPFTMQEQEDSVILVQEGDRVRVRLYNVGETFESIHTHGHDMYVTHRDGNPLNPDARFWVDTLTIGPAERYDVVLEMDNPGLWMMHTHVDHHVTNSHQAPGGGMSMIAYESALEETQGNLKPFAAELTGGKPYILPLKIPSDVVLAKTRTVGDDPTALPDPSAVSEVLAFDWSMPCATRAFSAMVQTDPSALSGAAGSNDLSFAVRDPAGGQLATFALGSGTSGRVDLYWNEGIAPLIWDRFTELPAGTYTLEVTGSAVDTEVTMSVVVDYFDSEQDVIDSRQQRFAGTACDEETRYWLPTA